MYKIVRYWPEKGQSGFLVWRYLLRRDDPDPAPWTAAGKRRILELGIQDMVVRGERCSRWQIGWVAGAVWMESVPPREMRCRLQFPCH